MARLTVTSRLIRDYCHAQGWEVPTGGTAFVWAIRSANPLAGNEVMVHPPLANAYDDVLGVGGTQWCMIPATTDPGRAHTVSPMNPRGAAWLVPGSYWFRQGFHKIPGNWALVQDEPVTIRRDRDRDGKPELSDGPRETGVYGIHVHVGGFLARLVERWSAGCLVGLKPSWPEFQAAVQRAGQQRVLVVLMDGALLQKWAEEHHA